MKSIFYLALRYILFHRGKSAVLVLCMSLTVFAPLSVHLLIQEYDKRLLHRAAATPLVLGPKGNRFDIVLQALYFRRNRLEPVEYGVVTEVLEEGSALALPVHCRYTARDVPIVGTDMEYFRFRKLRCAVGRYPQILGEVVLGAEAAKSLGLGPGDTVLSDQRSLYDISRTLPLRLHVVGTLEATASADDFAMFTDVKTTWVIAGLGHGHQDLAATEGSEEILETDGKTIIANASLRPYIEITPETLDSFHFHGDMAEFPVSAVVMVPVSNRERTILTTRYNASSRYQVLVPTAVLEELMGIVFKVRRFYDANFLLIALSTILFLTLVVLLSLRLRRNERRTLQKIGGSRWTLFCMQGAEYAILAGVSAALALVAGFVLILLAPGVAQVL